MQITRGHGQRVGCATLVFFRRVVDADHVLRLPTGAVLVVCVLLVAYAAAPPPLLLLQLFLLFCASAPGPWSGSSTTTFVPLCMFVRWVGARHGSSLFVLCWSRRAPHLETLVLDKVYKTA